MQASFDKGLSLHNELVIADRQGERIISSLLVGDQFYWRRQWMTIDVMQASFDKDRIYVRARDNDGKGRTFYFAPLLLFPSLITDEHAAAEMAPPTEIW